MKNFVYVISDGTYRKVGVTSRLDRRLKQLQIGHPTLLVVEHISEPMSRRDAFLAEQLAHSQLVAHRLHGEWFAVDKGTAIMAVESVTIQTIETKARCVPVLHTEFKSVADRIIQGMQ